MVIQTVYIHKGPNLSQHITVRREERDDLQLAVT